MQSTALADSGLGITSEEVAAVFKPFVARFVSPDDREWRAEIAKRKGKISRRYRTRFFFGWLSFTKRRNSTIVQEYSRAWQESQYEDYSLEGPLTRITPWEWRDQCMLASDLGATRFRQLLLSRLVERTKPRRVLEVGCGNGINLLLLACRFPDVDFSGIEFTRQGHLVATELQKHPALPQSMQDYAPLPLQDPTAFRRISFRQGSADALPFADGEFDLVVTVLALEQMEQIRRKALDEISRVTFGSTLMIEPFRDVNSDGWPRKNIIQRNYFQGRVADLPAYRLQPVMAVDDFPQETFLKVVAVLSEKRPL